MNFSTYPKADEYNEAWEEISTRLSSIRSSLEAKLVEQQRYNNLQIADRQALEDFFLRLENKVALKEAIKGSYREVRIEKFSNSISGLGYDEQGKYLTLPVQQTVNLRLGEPELLWDQSSEGLPGSWAETQQVSRDKDLRVQALPVLGNAQLAAMVDISSDTHFEFERCIVDEYQDAAVYDEMNGNVIGKEKKKFLDIIAPDRWEISIEGTNITHRVGALPGEFKPPLKLTVRIPVIDKIIPASSLVVTPYLPSNQYGSAPFRLTRVSGLGQDGRMLLDRTFTMEKVRSLKLPSTRLSQLEITFQQDVPYTTVFAHHYWEEQIVTERTGKVLFFINTGKAPRYKWNRIQNPDQPLGIISVKKGTFIQNLASGIADAAVGVGGLLGPVVGPSVAGVGAAFGNLMDSILGKSKTTVQRTAVRDGWDIFTGKRYAIGLTDISLKRNVYNRTGTAILGPYLFDTEIKHISINASYQADDPDKISFEYSADQESWTPIELDQVSPFVGKQVWLRVSMERGDNDSSSPLLHEVRIYGS